MVHPVNATSAFLRTAWPFLSPGPHAPLLSRPEAQSVWVFLLWVVSALELRDMGTSFRLWGDSEPRRCVQARPPVPERSLSSGMQGPFSLACFLEKSRFAITLAENPGSVP